MDCREAICRGLWKLHNILNNSDETDDSNDNIKWVHTQRFVDAIDVSSLCRNNLLFYSTIFTEGEIPDFDFTETTVMEQR